METGRRLTQSMFVGQVVGKSMEPRIPDGAWCLFTREVGGSRHGRILLVQHQSISDLDTGGQYTVKRYERAPQAAGEGRELRGMIVLRPINPDYEPIRIEEGDEEVQVMAELVEVLE